MDGKVHSSMQTNDREGEGISVLIFAFLSIFSVNSAKRGNWDYAYFL